MHQEVFSRQQAARSSGRRRRWIQFQNRIHIVNHRYGSRCRSNVEIPNALCEMGRRCIRTRIHYYYNRACNPGRFCRNRLRKTKRKRTYVRYERRRRCFRQNPRCALFPRPVIPLGILSGYFRSCNRLYRQDSNLRYRLCR